MGGASVLCAIMNAFECMKRIVYLFKCIWRYIYASNEKMV